MHGLLRPRLDLAAAAVAAVTAAAVLTAPPPDVAPPPPVHTAAVRLAASPVPPGGLIVSFWRNQAVYCALICPLLAQTGATAVTTTLQAPGRFFTTLSAGDVLKALGAAAASVTGPTRAAAQRAIDLDQAIPAQRALNALQVGVVGLLDVLPAARGGVPAVLAALDRARRDTYRALNLPFEPDPTPTVRPRGVFQVAVIAAIDVVAAVIFPAFNTVLAGVFAVPDAMAQELARTGNPVQALRAGVDTAAEVVDTAGSAIRRAVIDAVEDVRAGSAAAEEDVAREPGPAPPRRHRARDLPTSAVSEPRPAHREDIRTARPAPADRDVDPPAVHRDTDSDASPARADAGTQRPDRGVPLHDRRRER